MNVLFYIPVTGEGSEKIHGVVEMIAQRAKTEVFQSLNDVSRRLRQPGQSPSVAVLLAGDQKDLVAIASIRHLLSEIPVVLVLPVREENMADMGHTLSPRFLTYADSDFGEVAAVLGKMLENHKRKQVREKWYSIWSS